MISPSKYPPERYPRVLRAACLLALVALGLMTWSVLDPRVWPVMVAMTVAQAMGTLSLGAFVAVVIADMRRTAAIARMARRSSGPPS